MQSSDSPLPPDVRRCLEYYPDLSGLRTLHEGFSPETADYSSLCLEQVGLMRVLRWPEQASVLFWNWSGLSAARWLIEQGHKVQIYDERKDYREAAQILCGGWIRVSSPSDPLGERFVDGNDSFRFDVIFAGDQGLDQSDSNSTLVPLVIDGLRSGTTVVVSKPSGKCPTFSTSLAHGDTRPPSLASESILALPGVSEPVFLMREGFLFEKPGAWRHLARFIDEEGNPRPPGSPPMESVWAMFEERQKFPLRKVPCFEVLYEQNRLTGSPVQVDFIHQAIGERSPEFWTETRKVRGDTTVERRATLETLTPSALKGSARSQGVDHVLGSETYRAGKTLAEAWLSALSRNDSAGFLQLAKEFYLFLEEESKRPEGFAVDLIPDNLVIGGKGEIHPIDQEWRCPATGFDEKTAFCRGVVYFLARNALQLDVLPAARQWGPRHRDFVAHLCTTVGVSADDSVRNLERFERRFRSATLKRFGVIAVASMLERRFGDQDLVQLLCVMAFSDGREASRVLVRFPIGLARYGCRFHIRFSEHAAQGQQFSLIFPSWLANPRIESLKVFSSIEGQSAALIDCRGPGQIRSQAQEITSVEKRLVFGHLQDQDANGLSFSMPLDRETAGDDGVWDVDLSIAWPELIYGRGADEELVSRLWDKERNLQRVRDEVSDLAKQLADLRKSLDLRSAELELLKSSKAWRVAEVLRKIVFAWRVHQQETANLNAIEQLSQKPTAPRERLELILDTARPVIDAPYHDLPDGPVICVIVPVHNTPRPWLADAVNSVRSQTYPHWQLLLINDGSTRLETREYLDNLDDPKITKIQLTRSVGISTATQTGIEAAHGDFIALMDHDDMLAVDALEKVANVIQEDQADVIYTDETTFSDKTQERVDGYLGLPHLKPDYSPDLLLSHNYITHLLVARKEVIVEAGGFRSEFDGAQDYDLLLRMSEITDKIAHIPEPLYHWRQSVQSTSLDSGAKPQAHLRGKQALCEALARRGIDGEVLTANAPHYFRVRRAITERPSVDVIIPFRDQPLMLQRCIDALMFNTRYRNFRVLGVDNGSVEALTLEIKDKYERETDRVRFVSLDKPFNFSQLVNFGVQQAKGDHVVLMNNDIQVINSDWLEAMLEQSQRAEVGAVGAKLYYPDDTIQHAGIAIGIGNYAGHPHKHAEGGYSGYLNRLHNIQNVSAVTGAMMMVERRIYQSVGGFDEKVFKIACNDVDFCLRLRKQGLLNVFTPYARAYHHESVSRGYEDTPEKNARFAGEVEAFRKRHAEELSNGDPYYNPHFRLDTEEVFVRPWTQH